jgi:hypothetical protein
MSEYLNLFQKDKASRKDYCPTASSSREVKRFAEKRKGRMQERNMYVKKQSATGRKEESFPQPAPQRSDKQQISWKQ